MGSLCDREVACSASDRQGSNFESCVWRTVSSQSSHHPQKVLLAQFILYVHKGGLKPDSFHLFGWADAFPTIYFLIIVVTQPWGNVGTSVFPVSETVCVPETDEPSRTCHVFPLTRPLATQPAEQADLRPPAPAESAMRPGPSQLSESAHYMSRC